MIPCRLPPDSQRLHPAAFMKQCPQIFHAEDIIGRIQYGSCPAAIRVVGRTRQNPLRAVPVLLRRPASGCRKADSLLQIRLQDLPVEGRLLLKKSRITPKAVQIARLTSKAKCVCAAQFLQHRHRSPGKGLRAAGGIGYRQLQHQIRAGTERHLRSQIFVCQSRTSPLYEIAAHDNDSKISPGKLLRFPKLISVSLMKWVVFCYDSDRLQRFLSSHVLYKIQNILCFFQLIRSLDFLRTEADPAAA